MSKQSKKSKRASGESAGQASDERPHQEPVAKEPRDEQVPAPRTPEAFEFALRNLPKRRP